LEWRLEKRHKYYDWARIEMRYQYMRNLRKTDNIKGLAMCLRQDLVKNIGNICHHKLFNKCHRGTKILIENYHNEIIKCIKTLYNSQKLPPSLKLKFFAEARHSYGQTALFLSGGGAFAKYHNGVVKALYE